VYLREVFTQQTPQIRLVTIIASGVLGLVSIMLSFSITGALFAMPGSAFHIGHFFVDSYGALSFSIPAYLFFAAFLLADPIYRPGRIFILNALLFPFLTLAIGFVFIRDFNLWSERSPLIADLGKSGINLFVVLLTTTEGIAITVFTGMLFPPGYEKREYSQAEARSKRLASRGPILAGEKSPRRAAQRGSVRHHIPSSSLRLGKPPTILLLPYVDKPPVPSEEPEPAAELVESETQQASIPAKEFHLPQLKPLSTARVLRHLTLVTARSAAPQQDEMDEAAVRIIDNEDSIIEEDDDGDFIDIDEEEPPLEQVPPMKPVAQKNTWLEYQVPVKGILDEYGDGQYWIIDETTQEAGRVLQETLKEFHIQAEVTGIRKGPVITMFEILPAPGVKLSRIVGLQDNIALRLAASSVRIVAPIPGKHAVGIEVPNVKRNLVSFAEIIESEFEREKGEQGGKRTAIPVVLGKDISGEAQTIDLAQTPHLLIAGATGSGKSVCVNTMILSILYLRTPAECKLILIDPKIVELKLYNGIPHLLTPVITEPKKAFQALQYCIFEMERRYACLDSLGVRDIKTYNKRVKERNIAAEHIPYIVVIIDEFADLMATTGKELESTVARLAAMSRAVGIHLVLATQRPSIDVITGLIKANIPSRIAFMVASKIDSRIIIDSVGAEKLLGKGDMLYSGVVNPFPVRMQGAFISEDEVERVVAHIKTLGTPDYIDEEIFYDEDADAVSTLSSEGDDPLFEQALKIVAQQGKASASYLQRKLNIGYNRATRLVEEMEERGLVGPARGSKPRELLKGS
jgi:S-DNA-T family DNA segregation ATPase FtsK/SpoIIIE